MFMRKGSKAMNKATKDAYLDKMSAQLDLWSARLDVVKAKVAKGSADVRIDYQKQISDWQNKETAFKAKMEELRTAGTEGYEAVKASAQSAWTELNIIVEKFGDKK